MKALAKHLLLDTLRMLQKNRLAIFLPVFHLHYLMEDSCIVIKIILLMSSSESERIY